MSSGSVTFRPKARLLLQLGDQLIRNEAIAIFELVKNCYDANASFSKVDFIDVNCSDTGRIVIEDDGDGMDMDIITNIWMQPGTDHKEQIFRKYKKDTTYRGRLPIGEKGIGRFGAYKLGNTIEVVSKKPGSSKEVYIKIEWASFTNTDFLDDVEVQATERDLEAFPPSGQGTIITITNLKQGWTKRTLRETCRLLTTLNTPPFIKKMDAFEVEIHENLGWSEGLLSIDDIIDYTLFKGVIEIEADKIAKFHYEFTPWKSMREVKPRILDDTNIPMKNEVRDSETRKREFQPINLSDFEIGKIKIFIFAYSLDTGILKLGVDDRSGFKKYLEENGGMKVYRDGMRIYDYGEKTNDWLNSDSLRINRPGNHLSNNQYIGYVLINRRESADLTEKSNREGFVENEAYFVFQDAIKFAVRQFEVQRNIDKDTLNNFYGTKRAKEPVVRRISDLKEQVKMKVTEAKVKEDITIELSRIEAEYNDMVNVFLKSANVGINLGVAIHEIDKIIIELNRTLSSPNNFKHARELASRLTTLVKGYTLLLKGQNKGTYNLVALLKQALFNVEFRLRVHGIELKTNIDDFKNITIKCKKSITIGSIVNLIDNSIWWLSFRDVPSKKMFVGLTDENFYNVSVIVADNGPGFNIPQQDMVKPFMSGKPTGSGMGLGLFIANQCMEEQGGQLIFPNFKDVTIPPDFESGAITELAFRRTNK